MARHQRRSEDPMVRISKSLSSLLRHRAEKEGFRLLPGGFLYVDDILKHRHFTSVTEDQIQSIVANNDKQRFSLQTEEDTGRLMIRANQGHSMQVDDLELQPITNAEDFPVVIHGTYEKNYRLIANEGLKRMGRNHVHFAAGEPGEDGVISGMRQTCSIVIFVNLEKALKDGLQFFLSANNVILSPGDDNGVIGPQYFKKVKNRKSGKELPFSTKASASSAPSDSPPSVAHHAPSHTAGDTASPCTSSEPHDSCVVVTAEDLADELESGRRRNRKKGKQKK